MEQNFVIRSATIKDAKRLLEIYSYYVENTAISFEYETPKIDEFRHRIKQTLEKYPYLVAEKEGIIYGYAYAGPFAERAAYGRSCELSIYLDRHARKCGLGRRLYEALEVLLKEKGILNAYACIAYPEKEDAYLTKNSVEFHEHLGFIQVGRFHKCGYKFGRWYDMVYMEKMIGEHHNLSEDILVKKEVKG